LQTALSDKELAVEEARAVAEKLIDNVERVIVGKRREVELAVMALMCQGHVLIEDVPGVGKTMLARSIARSTGCVFKRIQFTPDLLPSDVTGVSVYNQKTGDFEYRPGPIMAQIVLADEINRATPKTQSALLEAMEEHQVTVDGVTRSVPTPFMVMATQNPIEYEGTFPLPEAQLDRFLMRVHLGYPSAGDEVMIMDRQQYVHPVEELHQVSESQEILALQQAVRQIYVDPLVKRYIASVIETTRQHESVYLGASPRGSLALYRTCQAQALLDGRDFVLPDDVKGLAYSALGHRLITSPAARAKGVVIEELVNECLERVPVPGVRAGRGSDS
jgi:MoxR-like ATPase